jgi:hypothetical protein
VKRVFEVAIAQAARRQQAPASQLEICGRLTSEDEGRKVFAFKLPAAHGSYRLNLGGDEMPEAPIWLEAPIYCKP